MGPDMLHLFFIPSRPLDTQGSSHGLAEAREGQVEACDAFAVRAGTLTHSTNPTSPRPHFTISGVEIHASSSDSGWGERE